MNTTSANLHCSRLECFNLDHLSSCKPQNDKITCYLEVAKMNQMEFSHKRYAFILQIHLVFNSDVCILGYLSV